MWPWRFKMPSIWAVYCLEIWSFFGTIWEFSYFAWLLPQIRKSVLTHKLCWYFMIFILHNFKPRDFSALTKIPANLYWLEIPQGVSGVSGWKFLQLVRRLQVGFRSRQIPPQLRRWLAWPGRFTDNAGCSRWETFVWPFNRPLTFPRNCQAAE